MTALTTGSPLSPPIALDPSGSGAQFWRDCMAEFDGFTRGDLLILEQTCKVLDVLDRLDAEASSGTVLMPATHGGMREHPALSEARQQRTLLARLVRQLNLPDGEQLAQVRQQAASMSARALARQRWG